MLSLVVDLFMMPDLPVRFNDAVFLIFSVANAGTFSLSSRGLLSLVSLNGLANNFCSFGSLLICIVLP